MESEIKVQEQAQQEVVQDVQQEPVAQEAPVQEERYQSRNFRELREQRELAEKRAAEAERRAQMYEAQLMQSQQAQPQKAHLDDDDFVDYRTLQQELQGYRQELNELKQNTNKRSAESQLKYDFPDIEQVVTADNFKMLQDREPHLAATIASGSDVYTAGAAAYRAIVGLGIVNKRQEPARNYESERAIAEANSKRPRPLGVQPVPSESPLAQGNMFAPSMSAAQREEKYKQMRDILDRR